MNFIAADTPLPEAWRPAAADAAGPSDIDLGADALTLANDVDVAALQPRLAALRTIALQFPVWTDGRAYSQARLLRVRYGYTGQLRATGDVLADMLPLLARTGFDAVQLRPDQRLETAERALRWFDPVGHYQGDVREPRPHFVREPAASPARGLQELAS